MTKRPTVVMQARQHVLARIREDRLQPEARLPPMGDLAEECQVSVATMREALRGLQANGIVEFRHGTGVFLRRDVDRIILPNPPGSSLEATVLVELLEARRLIEPRLAELASELATGSDLEHLDEAFKLSEAALEDAERDRGAAAIGFHRAIARCSGHSVLSQVVDSLLEVYAAEQHVIAQVHGNRVEDHAQHGRIFDAIRAGSPRKAKRAMEEHLSEVSKVIEDRL